MSDVQNIINPNGGVPVLAIEALVKCYRALDAQAPPPVAYTISVPVGTYRYLWNIQKPMRKKIARMNHSVMRPAPRHNGK